MKGKLIKHAHSYALKLNDKLVAFANPEDFSKNDTIGKLCIDNCKAIERGYDLDELAEEFAKNHSLYPTAQDDTEYGFKHGFQKALELMSDKKFSEENMINFGGFCVNNNLYPKFRFLDAFNDVDDLFKKYQPLQQSEWDVTFNPDEKHSDDCLILKIL